MRHDSRKFPIIISKVRRRVWPKDGRVRVSGTESVVEQEGCDSFRPLDWMQLQGTASFSLCKAGRFEREAIGGMLMVDSVGTSSEIPSFSHISNSAE